VHVLLVRVERGSTDVAESARADDVVDDQPTALVAPVGAEQVGVDLGAQGVGELVEVQTGGGGDLECLRGPGEQPGGVAEDGVEVVVAGGRRRGRATGAGRRAPP
jgi:hypothetical protein